MGRGLSPAGRDNPAHCGESLRGVEREARPGQARSEAQEITGKDPDLQRRAQAFSVSTARLAEILFFFDATCHVELGEIRSCLSRCVRE